MPPRSSKPKRPRDLNQLGKLIVDIASGEQIDRDPDEGKNPRAVALGRLGGKKGGVVRAQNLSDAERRTIAEKAAKARWNKKKTNNP